MKAKDAVGRKIVGVRQTRWFNDYSHKHEITVDALILDNGTELRPFGFPTETDHAATLLAVKKPKDKAKAPKPYRMGDDVSDDAMMG